MACGRVRTYEACLEERPPFFNPETERRAHDHRYVRELAHAVSGVGKGRLLDKRNNPYHLAGTCDDRS